MNPNTPPPHDDDLPGDARTRGALRAPAKGRARCRAGCGGARAGRSCGIGSSPPDALAGRAGIGGGAGVGRRPDLAAARQPPGRDGDALTFPRRNASNPPRPCQQALLSSCKSRHPRQPSRGWRAVRHRHGHWHRPRPQRHLRHPYRQRHLHLHRHPHRPYRRKRRDRRSHRHSNHRPCPNPPHRPSAPLPTVR